MKKNGFTLIELLVVVAIIGILAAVGVIAYNGYTKSAQRGATLAQHKQIVQFIKNKLALCIASDSGSLQLNSNRSIDCNVNNDAGGINSLNNIFITYFLEEGIKNPYTRKSDAVYTGTNGSNDTNGRMRFDETECSSGSKKKQIALWVKTHIEEDYKPTLIAMDGWCN